MTSFYEIVTWCRSFTLQALLGPSNEIECICLRTILRRGELVATSMHFFVHQTFMDYIYRYTRSCAMVMMVCMRDCALMILSFFLPSSSLLSTLAFVKSSHCVNIILSLRYNCGRGIVFHLISTSSIAPAFAQYLECCCVFALCYQATEAATTWDHRPQGTCGVRV